MNDKPRRYGCWAGRPQGQAEDPACCIKEIFPPGRGEMHRQCNSPRGFGPKGEYCKKHDPDAVAAKNVASDKAWKDREGRLAEIQKRAKVLAAQLGVDGHAHYVSARRFKDSGVVEKLVISFADAERLIDRLGGIVK